MAQVYNWDTNILEVNDKYKNHYYLELRGNKNVIKGSSGTGKSYLYDRLANLKKSSGNVSEYTVDNIVLLNKDNIGDLKEYKGKLIIIDRAELLLTEEEIDIINADDDNRYLIFSRVLMGLELSPNHQADLITENGITKMKYRFNVKGWC